MERQVLLVALLAGAVGGCAKHLEYAWTPGNVDAAKLDLPEGAPVVGGVAISNATNSDERYNLGPESGWYYWTTRNRIGEAVVTQLG
jgi:hypothetical protein